jgi:hypothetical protein
MTSESDFRLLFLQAERDEHLQMINEKQSRALLKNTFDPHLSQLTKVNKITTEQSSSALGSVLIKFEIEEQVAVYG